MSVKAFSVDRSLFLLSILIRLNSFSL